MKLFYSFLIVLSSAWFSFGQSSFVITPAGTDPTIDNAIDYATDIWSQYLNSPVPIKIKVIYADLTSAGPLAITIPNGRKDFSSAPIDSTWYATSLANSLEGTELNTGEVDMDIYVNSYVNYYFGTDGLPGPGQYDFVSIFLHEIAHGLGILSLTKVENGEGSFGYVTLSSIFPLPSSFPFPVLEGLPSVWDRFIVNSTGQQLIDQALFANPSTALRTQFQSNNLFFTGSMATAANGGNNPRMFAPGTYAYGSSLQHFNESTFPLSSGNSLMTPYSGVQEVEHLPGDILMGALQDIGWSTNVVEINEQEAANNIELYPNPATDFIELNFGEMNEGLVEVTILDLAGNVVMTQSANSSITNVDISKLPSGTYFCAVSGDLSGYLRFVKE